MAGYLTNGRWTPGDPHRIDAAGHFVRTESQFRDWLGDDGLHGFPAETGRYVLAVSYACPWAHRTLLARCLLGLEEAIALWIVEPVSADEGWVFAAPPPEAPIVGLRALHQLYTLHRPDYSGVATVPVLWDRKTRRIVNNESSEIIRMLGAAFAGIFCKPRELYPKPLRREIDAVNAYVYDHVNNGVYRCGFAKSDAARRLARQQLFSALDTLEEHLCRSRYLVGRELTEADLRLFPTLVRFDAVYYGLFQCHQRRIADYPNLANYTRDIYQLPGVAETVDLEQIKRHYYLSHPRLNPGLCIPDHPDFDFAAPHDRQRFS